MEANGAAVFVHGFNGDAENAWYNFQGLVNHQDHCIFWRGYDLFFFQYDGLWDHIEYSSNRLQQFLRDIYPVPNSELMTEDLSIIGGTKISILPADRQYRQLILIGHSLGCVVIRHILLAMRQPKQASAGVQGLVDVEKRGELSVRSSEQPIEGKLRLFAPAIAGYRPSGLFGVLARMSFVGDLADWAFSSASPPYQDLKDYEDPRGLLAVLKSETERLAADHPMLSADILWARNDRVVPRKNILSTPRIGQRVRRTRLSASLPCGIAAHWSSVRHDTSRNGQTGSTGSICSD